MYRSYAGFVLNSHKGTIVFSVAVITALQYLIVWLISTLDYTPAVTAAFEQLPALIQGFFNEEFLTRLSARGAVAFGFDHPLVLALLALNAILIPTRHISGEIESGTFELLMAHPLRRSGVLTALWLSGCLAVFCIAAGAVCGASTAVAVFHQWETALGHQIVKIGANLFLLYVLILSYSLLISTFGKEGTRTGVLAAGITLLFYFFHFLAKIWSWIEWTRPMNIFTYYQPQELMFDRAPFLAHVGVLLAGIFLCFTVAAWRMQTRDIPG